MTPQAGEAVLYTPCQLTKTTTLSCFHGPLDGEEDWIIDPDCCTDGRMVLWYLNETETRELHAVYQVAWRWTRRNGNEGVVLVWVPELA